MNKEIEEKLWYQVVWSSLQESLIGKEMYASEPWEVIEAHIKWGKMLTMFWVSLQSLSAPLTTYNRCHLTTTIFKYNQWTFNLFYVWSSLCKLSLDA